MKKTIFSGTATALITPFCDDGNEVDYSAFEKLVCFQLENKVNALVVSGTTGESPVLTSEEKINLLRIAKDSGAKNVPVIAGTGSNNTIEAVKKSNDAEKQGVDGLLIVTPYYNKCSPEGLIKHYYYIADRVSAPVIVYNVPSRTGMSINSETYKALSEHKNIVAVKEASGNISEINKSISLCSGSLDFYSGNDDQTVNMMSTGAKGVISVASNIIPLEMKRMTDYCLENNFAKAGIISRDYSELISYMFCEINPVPVKYACSLLYGFSDKVRMPLLQLDENKKQILKNILKKYQLI